MRFSERYGHKSFRQVIQMESADEELRNALWNVITALYWNHIEQNYSLTASNLYEMLTRLWAFYFKRTLDTMPIIWREYCREIRSYFYRCEWYEVFDFLEAVLEYAPAQPRRGIVEAALNEALEREVSGYRFSRGQAVAITEPSECVFRPNRPPVPVETVHPNRMKSST